MVLTKKVVKMFNKTSDFISILMFHIFFIYLWVHFIYIAGECGNKECPFRHVDPESKRKDCAWYDRGFCRHGKYISQFVFL